MRARVPRCGLVAGALLTIVVVLSACGGSESRVSGAERAQLAPLVEQVRHAAESRDRGAAQLSLTAVRETVLTDVQRGDISSADASQILAAVDGVESRLNLVVTRSTTPASIATTSTTAAPAPPGNPHGRGGKHNGDGQGGDG